MNDRQFAAHIGREIKRMSVCWATKSNGHRCRNRPRAFHRKNGVDVVTNLVFNPKTLQWNRACHIRNHRMQGRGTAKKPTLIKW